MLSAMGWHALEPVDDAFFTTAPHRYRLPVEIAAPPERVWESLQSDESLAAWGPGIKSVRWTTPRPFAIGTAREVTLPLGAITVRETFYRWDEGTRHSFYVTEANRPLLRRFAEDFVVEPHAGGSLLTWTVALEAAPRYRRLIDLLSPVTRLAFGQTARSAKAYFAKH